MTLRHASLENKGPLQDLGLGFNNQPHERQRRVPDVETH